MVSITESGVNFGDFSEEDLYKIEPYESSSKYSEIMKQVSAEVYLGAMVFFYDLSKKLLEGLNIYTQKELKKTQTITP